MKYLHEPIYWLIASVVLLSIAIYAQERGKYKDAFADWLDDHENWWIAGIILGIAGAAIASGILISQEVTPP